jgi:hypothetical protein
MILFGLALAIAAIGCGPAQAQQAAEKEPNNDMSQANPMTFSKEIKGFPDPEGDEDWFLLNIPEPGLDILAVEVTTVPSVNLKLTFLDAEGNELNFVDVSEESEKQKITRLRQRPGRYYVRVQSTSGSSTDTPYVLRAGAELAPPASQADISQALRRALDFLASRQTAQGYFEEEHPGKAGLAVMAFIGGKCAAKDYSKYIKAGISYLKSTYASEPVYESDAKNAPKTGWSGAVDRMYSHAIATLTLAEAIAELKDASLKPLFESALELIIQAQNTEHKPEGLQGPVDTESEIYGGWRYGPDNAESDISVTGWQILALRAGKNLGFSIPEWTFPSAAKYLRSLYNEPDGSFGYQQVEGDSCARAGMGALGLQLSGNPDDSRVRGALRFMLDHPPAWNYERPGGGYPFYYWYYGTRAMLVAGGDDWQAWHDRVCRMLVENQNEDGSWAAEQSEQSAGLIYTTALGAMILEFCCGYLPVYMPQPPKVQETATVRVLFEKEATETAKNIEIIFDASNSMWGQIAGEAKIVIARRVLTQMINALSETLNVGLRVYGHRFGLNEKQACTDTELLVPIGPISKAQLIETINKIPLKGKTPLVLSILEAIKDFESGAKGSVILITDGIESCNGDINSIAPAIKKSSLEIKVNIVGFDIQEASARLELETISKSTGGMYLDAKDAQTLLASLQQTLQAEYQLLNEKGEIAGRGTVGGDPVKIRAGAYTLRVLLAPQPLEGKLNLKAGEKLVLVLKKTAGKWALQ